MASRFVKPETARLDISNGDWLLVKKRLTAGEERAAHARMYQAGVDGSTRVNPLQVGLAMTTAYLLDWSLPEYAIRDKSIDDVEAALNALSPEDFAEINDAVAAHERAMQAERTQIKNSPDGGNESSAISPSLDSLAGATSGSTH